MLYCYSNNGLSWRGVDSGYTAQTGEVLFDSQPTSSQLEVAFPNYTAASNNDSVLQQIAQLELLQTDRMVRGALAGLTITFPATDPNFPNMTDAQALASIESKVSALRAQLVKIS